MKTKVEIREQIGKLRQLLKGYPQVPPAQKAGWLEVIRGQIRALKWALGHKAKHPMYWCGACQRSHLNLKCPYCGSERLADAVEVE